LTTHLDEVSCCDCKKSLVRRGVCPVCGERKLVWSTHPRNKTQIPDGRLTLNDVETIFYLACDYCSETLITRVEPYHVADALTEMGWRP
jgi:hypothetical protein